MIETTIKRFLESKLSVPVLLEKPENQAPQYVIIEHTGGTQKNTIPSTVFTIQSYELSLQKAAELNEQVKNWMLDGIEGLITVESIAKVTLNSDYNFTDTTSKRYRYQAVFEIIHY